jgi:hypothetical protein
MRNVIIFINWVLHPVNKRLIYILGLWLHGQDNWCQLYGKNENLPLPEIEPVSSIQYQITFVAEIF